VIRAARIARRWDRRYAPIVAAVADRRASLLARLTRLDQVLAPSRTMEAMLLGHGLDPRRLRFVPYGIDLHPFGEAPPRQPGDRLRVGYVGTLVRHKGAHVLCEAVRLLPPDLRVDVVIHGDPTAVPGYAARLRRIARGDPRVHFAGTFPLSAIAGVLARLDVLVVPSLWYESTPLVIYAAQAARTPVFATGLAGMAEVVHHEQNGLLFERGDAPGLAELIHRCARDRSLLPRLAGNAVVPRSIESFADELEGIYREVSRPGR
jgi:glycosyltransferase involved in cell wall biosynthesis